VPEHETPFALLAVGTNPVSLAIEQGDMSCTARQHRVKMLQHEIRVVVEHQHTVFDPLPVIDREGETDGRFAGYFNTSMLHIQINGRDIQFSPAKPEAVAEVVTICLVLQHVRGRYMDVPVAIINTGQLITAKIHKTDGMIHPFLQREGVKLFDHLPARILVTLGNKLLYVTFVSQDIDVRQELLKIAHQRFTCQLYLHLLIGSDQLSVVLVINNDEEADACRQKKGVRQQIAKESTQQEVLVRHFENPMCSIIANTVILMTFIG